MINNSEKEELEVEINSLNSIISELEETVKKYKETKLLKEKKYQNYIDNTSKEINETKSTQGDKTSLLPQKIEKLKNIEKNEVLRIFEFMPQIKKNSEDIIETKKEINNLKSQLSQFKKDFQQQLSQYSNKMEETSVLDTCDISRSNKKAKISARLLVKKEQFVLQDHQIEKLFQLKPQDFRQLNDEEMKWIDEDTKKPTYRCPCGESRKQHLNRFITHLVVCPIGVKLLSKKALFLE